MTLDRKHSDHQAQPERALYLGGAIALPFAVLLWTVLLGTLFWRL